MTAWYAYCEPMFGGNFRTLHIRKLSAAGLMLGGGIDTIPLCGRLISGWDVEQQVVLAEARENAERTNPNGTRDTCPACVEVLANELGG